MLNLMHDAPPINTSVMPAKITGASIHQIQLKTRMPFKYGIATMTEVPMVFVRIEAEIDVITCGDHLWDQREVVSLLNNEPRFVRPENYPEGTPGQGFCVQQIGDLPPIGVLNLQGQTFMKPIENPFFAADAAVDELREQTPIILVDMHAETTSEKIAMGRFLDGRVSAVIGTHTHVQTADEHIFPGGTAFLCDAGCTGPQESILGREIEPIIQRFLTYQPQRFAVASKQVTLNGAVIDIDELSGKATSIERVSELLPDTQSEE